MEGREVNGVAECTLSQASTQVPKEDKAPAPEYRTIGAKTWSQEERTAFLKFLAVFGKDWGAFKVFVGGACDVLLIGHNRISCQIRLKPTLICTLNKTEVAYSSILWLKIPWSQCPRPNLKPVVLVL